MHSKGEVGAQFRHSASNDLSISDTSLLFSLFLVEYRTLPICLISFDVCHGEVKELVMELSSEIIFAATPLDMRHKL